jgi:multidrug efflux pump subunit AcrA (membrane-fusion protein)
VSNTPRQQSLRGDDSAREVLQREKERQRQLKEKYEAEARAQRQAKQAELERIEKARQQEEVAAQLAAQREAEEAEALRRQREEQRAEQERGKRLQKAETQKVLQQREENVRKAKLEEKERQATLAKLEHKSRKAPSSSPPVSPPRQQEMGFGMFKRRKDDALGLDAPVQQSNPPQLSLSFDDKEEETIRPGGGGVVLGIDAPTSAVNAGDRVCILSVSHNGYANRHDSASKLCAMRNASCYQ